MSLPLPSDRGLRVRCPVQISEELHFCLKQELATRPRIKAPDFKSPRRVSMDRLLDWLCLGFLKSKSFRVIDTIARNEHVPLGFVIEAAYDFAVNQRKTYEAYLRKRAAERGMKFKKDGQDQSS